MGKVVELPAVELRLSGGEEGSLFTEVPCSSQRNHHASTLTSETHILSTIARSDMICTVHSTTVSSYPECGVDEMHQSPSCLRRRLTSPGEPPTTDRALRENHDACTPAVLYSTSKIAFAPQRSHDGPCGHLDAASYPLEGHRSCRLSASKPQSSVHSLECSL
jgi:hypothetical protein